MNYVNRLLAHLSSIGYGSLATLTGRYYAMDRDTRYERIKIAFEGLVKGVGESVPVDNLVKVRKGRRGRGRGRGEGYRGGGRKWARAYQ